MPKNVTTLSMNYVQTALHKEVIIEFIFHTTKGHKVEPLDGEFFSSSPINLLCYCKPTEIFNPFGVANAVQTDKQGIWNPVNFCIENHWEVWKLESNDN